ncbi:unnamed protein product, partial [Ectocarpus fasciculatus]
PPLPEEFLPNGGVRKEALSAAPSPRPGVALPLLLCRCCCCCCCCWGCSPPRLGLGPIAESGGRPADPLNARFDPATCCCCCCFALVPSVLDGTAEPPLLAPRPEELKPVLPVCDPAKPVFRFAEPGGGVCRPFALLLPRC